jgi:hypothetical protein
MRCSTFFLRQPSCVSWRMSRNSAKLAPSGRVRTDHDLLRYHVTNIVHCRLNNTKSNTGSFRAPPCSSATRSASCANYMFHHIAHIICVAITQDNVYTLSTGLATPNNVIPLKSVVTRGISQRYTYDYVTYLGLTLTLLYF